MTDKQIITDGVDVSKCIHIDNWKHCNCCNDLIKTIYPKASQCLIEEDLRCEIYSNCYYKQLARKEQECEELKKDLHKNFEEKDKLHLIIDRLLEASGYDTNTASAEDFEDVYENMRYEKQQLEKISEREQ